MRKRILGNQKEEAGQQEKESWIDLELIAQVEVTSEQSGFPIENALIPGKTGGWRAAEVGPQTIRLLFDRGQFVRTLHLRFVDTEHERSQEIAVRCATQASEPREIVRQQWSFSPGGSTEEVENFSIQLADVTSIEVVIDPDRSVRRHPATLAALRIG